MTTSYRQSLLQRMTIGDLHSRSALPNTCIQLWGRNHFTKNIRGRHIEGVLMAQKHIKYCPIENWTMHRNECLYSREFCVHVYTRLQFTQRRTYFKVFLMMDRYSKQHFKE
ncbi:hypothetical protein KP509_21G045500 [Ceratopteris richardii]|uniref:Uncharacterized protein n=1 Tax=Ceratopteris richardii TaxID=49495 RepID=A0A8T2SCK9_CERRI|nr:hypothetical protein KP509_21G045500 [Ceratopteris richardii]